MKFRNSRMLLTACAATLTAAALAGCGSDSSSPAPAASTPSGTVVQGPVENSMVFADSLTSGIPFVKDAEEVYTFTAANGKFTLPSTPAYTYRLVSTGGTDTLTNRPAIQMVAPQPVAGVKPNITALTTLVALAPADKQQAMKDKIAALAPNFSFDADISTNVSTAALKLIKTVEATLETLTSTLDKNETLPAGVLADIQAKAATAIATQLANPAVTTADLYSSTALTTQITAALNTALTGITTTYGSVVSVTNASTIASTIAGSAVTAIASQISAPTTSAATTEAAVVNTAFVNSIVAVLDPVITAQQTANVTVQTDNTPPTATTNHTNGATNVNLSTTLQAHFSEPIDPGTLTATTITLKAGATAVAGSISYDPDTMIVTFTPTATLTSNTAYTFTLTAGIKDLSGNAMTATAIAFTTINTATTGSTGSTGSTNF